MDSQNRITIHNIDAALSQIASLPNTSSTNSSITTPEITAAKPVVLTESRPEIELEPLRIELPIDFRDEEEVQSSKLEERHRKALKAIYIINKIEAVSKNTKISPQHKIVLIKKAISDYSDDLKLTVIEEFLLDGMKI